MKDKIKKIIFKKEQAEKELRSKWWHRLIKVFLNLSLILIFICSFVEIFNDGRNIGENILVVILGSLLFSVIAYFFLNVIYYRVILYIIYGKNKYSQLWSIKKIITFILSIIFLYITVIGIAYLEEGSIILDLL